MKKISNWALSAIVAALVSVGCGHSASSKLDVKSFEAAFSSAQPEIKGVVDKGLLAIKSTDYQTAFAELATLLKKEGLSAEQQQALQTMLHQLAQFVPPRPALPPGAPPAK